MPLIDIAPLQAPEAVQDVALLTDQLSVALEPLLTLVGVALKAMVGAGGAVAVTVTDCAAVPPLPVHVSVYLVVTVSAAVALVPLIGSAPFQPPEAVQEVALVTLQFNMAVLPLATVVGLAASVTAGAGLVTETEAD